MQCTENFLEDLSPHYPPNAPFCTCTLALIIRNLLALELTIHLLLMGLNDEGGNTYMNLKWVLACHPFPFTLAKVQ